MNNTAPNWTRRKFVTRLAGLVASLGLAPNLPVRAHSSAILKIIPKTGEKLPIIGMGTSRTFDALNDAQTIQQLQKVLIAFFKHGGALIDSSPMYASSEQVLGALIKSPNLFAATKVWTNGQRNGVIQMEQSRQFWKVEHFDLMQIHNLRDWRTHLETLKAMKAEGKIRYIGITTSHGRDHNELESILSNHPFDFVQLSYNIENRDAEQHLLPIATEKGIAVIVNRPFARGGLFRAVKGKQLPEWAKEFDCTSWGQFFLKYVASNSAVTCTIPATSKVHHMIDNMGAGVGRLPNENERTAMVKWFEAL